MPGTRTTSAARAQDALYQQRKRAMLRAVAPLQRSGYEVVVTRGEPGLGPIAEVRSPAVDRRSFALYFKHNVHGAAEMRYMFVVQAERSERHGSSVDFTAHGQVTRFTSVPWLVSLLTTPVEGF